MDIETRKLKHYLTLFNNTYFDKDHMWILYDLLTKPELYCINNKTIMDMDYLQWI